MDVERYKIYRVTGEMWNGGDAYPNTIFLNLQWDANVGFGNLTFNYNTKTTEWKADTEYMGEEFCSLILSV